MWLRGASEYIQVSLHGVCGLAYIGSAIVSIDWALLLLLDLHGLFRSVLDLVAPTQAFMSLAAASKSISRNRL